MVSHKKVILLLFLLVLLPGIVFASNTVQDMIIYRGGGNAQIPEYRTRTSTTYDAELNAISIGSNIEFVKILNKPIINSPEKILCTKDSANDINCQIFNGTSWGNLLEVSSNAGLDKGYDVAYESLSGRAVVCYRGSVNQTPSCRIWNGSSWGAEFNANNVGAAISTMRLVADKNSDYIAMITRDGNSDINVQIWNGNSWGNLFEVSSGAGNCSGCLAYDGSWESTSGDLVLSWFDDASDSLYSREFDKNTLWSSQMTGVVTGLSTSDNVFVEMDNDPISDGILVGVLDDNDTIRSNYWNGIGWGTQVLLSSDINGSVNGDNHLFDLAFEQLSDNDALITYGSTAALLKYRVWDSGTSSWESENSLPAAVEDKDWHLLISDPFSQKIMLTAVGVINDVDSIEWSGNAWDANWTSLDTASNDQYWNAWFTYDYENEDNHPPVIIFNAAAQKSNGSGLVDISVEVSDEGLHRVKAKVEYETDAGGACDGPWASATLVGPSTVDHNDTGGAPDINNSSSFQVGSGMNTKIVTAFGSNTVQFDWNTAADLPNGNSTYCLRIIGSDESDESTATTTLVVDNVAPTGLTNLVNMGSAASAQHLDWQPVTETNFSHYEIWYGINQSDVENRTGTAVEFDIDDFFAMSLVETRHAHIISLTPNTSYYFKLWAVDDYGNEVATQVFSATTDPAGNSIPTAGVPVIMGVAIDGSGYVTVSTSIQDADLDPTLMRVRFSTDGGLNFFNGKIVSVAPSYGTTSIDVDDFQIGKTDKIDTVPEGPHSVGLMFVWDSRSPENQNGGLGGVATSTIIRVTPRDNTGDIGNDFDSLPFFIDNASPVLAEVTAIPTSTSDNTPNYTFYSNSTGTIMYAGSCTSTTNFASIGSNTIALAPLADGSYSNCTIRVVDGFSNTSTPLSVSTFTIDTTNPSGLNELTIGNNGQTTQSLSWSAVTELNFNHYEIWYGTNQTDVQNRNGTASEWDDTDDANLAVRTHTTTTITSLIPATTYYYKIWAIDTAGNESTVASVSSPTDPNDPPVGSFTSATMPSGDFNAQITIVANDLNGNPVSAKIEYESDADGNCNGPWAKANLSGPISALFDDLGGEPDIDNISNYQIGSVTGTKIMTDTPNNSVSFEWDTVSNLSSNGNSICMRLTLFDGADVQTIPATTTLLVDNVVPVITVSNITQSITQDGGVLGTANIGDILTVYWDNSATGDNNSDIASAFVNLEAYGGAASQAMYDDGTNGDQVAGDDIYSYSYTVTSGSANSTNAHVHIRVVDMRNNETEVAAGSFVPVNNVPQLSSTPVSGGALPPAFMLPPIVVEERLVLLVNDGQKQTDSRIVKVEINASSNTQKIAISNKPDFSDGFGLVDFRKIVHWDLCGMSANCSPGEYNIYIRLYNINGISSDVMSSKLDLVEGLGNLQGKTSKTVFSRPLYRGLVHSDVLKLQEILNMDERTKVASKGAGSPGKETRFFGPATLKSVKILQELYKLAKPGDPGYGFVGPLTRKLLNSL